jgi:hypothetical protein
MKPYSTQHSTETYLSQPLEFEKSIFLPCSIPCKLQDIADAPLRNAIISEVSGIAVAVIINHGAGGVGSRCGRNFHAHNSRNCAGLLLHPRHVLINIHGGYVAMLSGSNLFHVDGTFAHWEHWTIHITMIHGAPDQGNLDSTIPKLIENRTF